MSSHVTALATLAEDSTGGPLDTIMGLPVHPLVVHAAVVLLPLAATGLIAIILVPRWRRALGWLVLGGLAAAAGAAFVAKESGEKLAARVGEPALHAELGEQLPIMAFVLLVVGAVWFLLARRDERGDGGPRTITRVMGVIAILVSLLNLVWVVRVGHSGAEAVWAGTIAASGSAAPGSGGEDEGDDGGDDDGDDEGDDDGGDGSAASAAPSTSASSTAAAYTMAEVATHSGAADCWAAIDGDVYDLTAWASEHPGGPERIVELCGTDGTAAFRGQHGSELQPNAVLAGFQIGVLG